MLRRRRAARLVRALCVAATAFGLCLDARGQDSDYLIGPRDVLAVTVTNQPALSGTFTVVADGTVTYPLLGAVPVGGLSLRAVERQLTTRLADGLLNNPIVSVSLSQAGQPVRLRHGRSPSGGQLSAVGPHDRARSAPQGRCADADRRHGGRPGRPDIPGKDDAPTVLHVSLDALQRGDATQNIELAPGDLVFVPRLEPR